MRQFNHDDDDVDYAALKEARANDRESIKEIRDSCKIDEEDLFAKLAAAAQGASGEQRRAAQRNTITSAGTIHRPSSSMQRQASQPIYEPEPEYVSKYAEVIDTLNHFNFSTDEERRQKQMKIIAKNLRSALHNMVLEEVAVNTKSAFKGHAYRVVPAPGGLKVYFEFGESKFTVTAKGGFHGNETVCVHQNNGKTKASVLRIEGEDYTDLSDSFEIIIGKVE